MGSHQPGGPTVYAIYQIIYQSNPTIHPQIAGYPIAHWAQHHHKWHCSPSHADEAAVLGIGLHAS